jgi:MFS family permease
VEVPSLLGLATNLKDGLVWLSLPLLLAGRGMDLVQIGIVAGLYPLVWAAGQPVFGPLSDRIGRRALIAMGMALQGVGLVVLAAFPAYAIALAAAVAMGLGTSMAYPVLIAAVADRVAPSERATALGIYRFFRDGGYAVGAIVGGLGLVHLASVTAWTGFAFLPLAALAWFVLRSSPPAARSSR